MRKDKINFFLCLCILNSLTPCQIYACKDIMTSKGMHANSKEFKAHQAILPNMHPHPVTIIDEIQDDHDSQHQRDQETK